MKVFERLGRAALAAVLLAVLTVPAVFGYAGQVAGQVSVAVPSGTIACNTAITVSATVLDVNGKPFDTTTVTWSFKAGTSQTGDKINTLTSTTNASGVATTTVTLACIAGSRTVVATAGTGAGAVLGEAVLGLTAAGLPNTSTLPDGSTPIWAYLLAALAVVVGLGLGVRQLVVRR